MKVNLALASVVVVCAILAIGCEEEIVRTQEPDTSLADRAIVDSYSDLAIQNAIIAQHSMYPYHFVVNGAQLNALGELDIEVLIRHFGGNPGEIALRREDTPSFLYLARLQTIQEKLLAAGIPQDKIKISDGMPGGDGMPSNSVIQILKISEESRRGQSQWVEGGGTGMGTGTSSGY